MKTNFSKLSIVCLIMAMTAVFFNSCKSDDNSNDPITPQSKPVETIVGFAINSEALDYLDITATQVDANGKETSVKFASYDKNLGSVEDDVILMLRHAEESGNPAAPVSYVRGTVTGTTAKAFTNNMKFTFKFKDGYKFPSNNLCSVAVYTVEKVENEVNCPTRYVNSMTFKAGEESKLISFLEEAAKNATITTTVK